MHRVEACDVGGFASGLLSGEVCGVVKYDFIYAMRMGDGKGTGWE